MSRFGISLDRSDAYGGDQASADPGAFRAMLVAALEERTIEDIGDNLAPERTCESISRGDQSFQRSTACDHHVHDLAQGKSHALEERSDHMAWSMAQRQTDESPFRSWVHKRGSLTDEIGQEDETFRTGLDFGRHLV